MEEDGHKKSKVKVENRILDKCGVEVESQNME